MSRVPTGMEVTAALETLPALRRSILLTAAMPGVTATAIAERFGWTVEFVHHEIATGLTQLRASTSLTQ